MAVELLGGRYRLVERLGVGGMSVVWRAHDRVLGRQVAVKVLSPRYAGDRASRQRIRTEAQAAALLSHPNVTNVYDYGESINAAGEPVPFVVMELVHGSSLAARLAAGPLPWRLAVRICAQVAAALAAAHARGLVHRDVKPGNVMLTSAGAKVVDFGIAAVAGEEGDAGSDGTLVGTPAYLAPERLTGGPVEPASDVYALGVLLYRALAGVLPWPASSTTEMISSHFSAEPRPLPPIDGLPAEVAELCARCLAKAPAQRPTSREVARTLTLAVGLGTAVRHGLQPDAPADAEAGVPDGRRGAEAGGPDGRRGDGTAPRLVRSASPEGVLADAVLAGAALDEMALSDPALAGLDRVDGGLTGDTALVPRRSRTGARSARARRRVRLLAKAGAGLLGLAGLITAVHLGVDLLTGQADPPAAAAIGDGPAGAGQSRQSCQVRYQTRSDRDGVFVVEMTIRNDGPATLHSWRLSFTFAGDQQIVATQSAVPNQSGAAVVLQDDGSNGELPSGAAVTIGFTGAYHAGNPLPTGFRLNQVGCGYLLIGASGATVGAGQPPAAGDADGRADIPLPDGTPMPSPAPVQPNPATWSPSPPDNGGTSTTPAPTGTPSPPPNGARTTQPPKPPATGTATPSHRTYR